MIIVMVILKIMKVDGIISSIEVENDDCISCVEVSNVDGSKKDIGVGVRNISSNGNGDDINKVYGIVDNDRFDIGSKVKDMGGIIDDGIDD